MATTELQRLETEKYQLVQRYAASRGITYQAAEAELAQLPKPPLDREEMQTCLRIAGRMNIPFEQALHYQRGERSFKYDGAGGNPPAQPPSSWPNVPEHKDPAADTTVHKLVNTINGKPAMVGGKITREQMEEIHDRLRVRRGRGEDVSFGDVLRELLGEE